jgi:hypothetical protein
MSAKISIFNALLRRKIQTEKTKRKYHRRMIRSMTGFGKASVELDNKNVNVEIRSLNSKGADVPEDVLGVQEF